MSDQPSNNGRLAETALSRPGTNRHPVGSRARATTRPSRAGAARRQGKKLTRSGPRRWVGEQSARACRRDSPPLNIRSALVIRTPLFDAEPKRRLRIASNATSVPAIFDHPRPFAVVLYERCEGDLNLDEVTRQAEGALRDGSGECELWAGLQSFGSPTSKSAIRTKSTDGNDPAVVSTQCPHLANARLPEGKQGEFRVEGRAPPDWDLRMERDVA
jgi:hypothetical protein